MVIYQGWTNTSKKGQMGIIEYCKMGFKQERQVVECYIKFTELDINLEHNKG